MISLASEALSSSRRLLDLIDSAAGAEGLGISVWFFFTARSFSFFRVLYFCATMVVFLGLTVFPNLLVVFFLLSVAELLGVFTTSPLLFDC